MLVATYALSNQLEEHPEQGLKHTISAAAIGIVFMVFATYGADILRRGWVRYVGCALLLADIIAIVTAGDQKNATAGTLIYVCGLFFVAACSRSDTSGASLALCFVALGVALSFIYEFRYLTACSAVFLVAFMGAKILRRRWFWLVGVIGSAGAILTVTWFFLTFDNRGFAWELGQAISSVSGHRANSGRDELWPYLVYAIQERPWFGLGAGTLPRDLFSTNLSAHSYYLQVYLQLGALGVGLVICLLLSVWQLLSKAESSVGKFGAALFLMFVVHNATEVLMLQNNVVLAVAAWSCIGLAIASDQVAQTSQPNRTVTACLSEAGAERGAVHPPDNRLVGHRESGWS
ncbi:O-antigen ligase family protein [Mycolicibacterium sp. PDY-3]|uniref:O-antigen ligase family protein n=1 Tax=Mycolicibacterium sp. PDY-3 TaxID=3376069 RepID=UPI003787EE6E